ncbi:chromate transporter [Flavobacteriaceae bacterium MAR_2010_188]|nr:chromate transporter [Flavobacteriaceae bacterium MAR_2010_188]
METTERERLKEVASVFFKLGCISFGGPAVHISMMEDEIVKKRKWISTQHFLDLIGATNIIPGPNSTEMTMHCGYERAGVKGLFVAGFCFIFPAVIITGFLAYLYQEYGQLPEVEPFIYGIKPAVIAIILMAAFRLGKKAVKNTTLAVIGILTLLVCFLGVNEIIALFGAGLIGFLIYKFKKNSTSVNSFIPLIILQIEEYAKLENIKILLVFLKIGAILYGSGYVLFAFLDAELVANGWMSRQALVDAIAVGQFTPGPVLSTATFVGWQLGGFAGAIAATAGIFLPSFIFVLILNPLVPKMRKSEWISAVLDAINVAAVALILYICIKIGQETLLDWRTILIAIISLITVFYFNKLNSAYIVLGGALLGYILLLI